MCGGGDCEGEPAHREVGVGFVEEVLYVRTLILIQSLETINELTTARASVVDVEGLSLGAQDFLCGIEDIPISVLRAANGDREISRSVGRRVGEDYRRHKRIYVREEASKMWIWI